MYCAVDHCAERAPCPAHGDCGAKRGGLPSECCVLTARGWVPVGATTTDDEFASLDAAGVLDYQRPTLISRRWADDERLHGPGTPYVGLRAAAGHMLWHAEPRTRARVAAATLLDRPVVFARAARNALPGAADPRRLGSGARLPLATYLRALAAWLRAAFAGPPPPRAFELCRAARTVDTLADHDALVSAGIAARWSGGALAVDSPELCAEFARDTSHGVWLPAWVWRELSEAQAGLLAGALFADYGDTHCRVRTTRHAGDLQRLALHAGLYAWILPGGKGGTLSTLVGLGRPDHRDTLADGPARTTAYTGALHSVVVPGGLIYVRQSYVGAPVWVGGASV